ncbi:MAG: uracil-DNA glycosylase [Verrucomicrobiales bacterium]|jgi:uracil-DNA glycosylase family 4
MASDVSLAAQHLIRYLQHQQEAGHGRAYLTDEAKACLRAMYLQARQPKPAAAAVASPVPLPVREAAPAADLPPAPEPDSPYPSVLVASPRTVLTPEGATKEAQIINLAERIASDSEAQLPSLRDTMVFSVGSLNAELMVVGEAPGSEEENQQEPFVGKAGQLLTKIIQAMGLQRESVYISNIVKYRPAMPDQGIKNRMPTSEEMQACLPYLMAEIEIVQPKVIVAVGVAAAEGLTGRAMAIDEARGKVRSWRGLPFVITYHPSYLIDNDALSERRKVWEDMLLVMEVLQMPISTKQRGFFKSR